MPAVTSGKILVTGANGYVAAWVLKDLLENGYSVRGTVRSESKATYLRDYFKTFGDKLELVIVDDITKDGAFDEVTADTDAILHIASPVHATAAHPDEIVGPAVKGTTSILFSALKNKSSVKRVFVMSSAAAIFPGPPPGQPVTTQVRDEGMWNEESVAHVREKGADADKMHMYRASKTLAERAAWDFVVEHKEEIGGAWDLVTFNPPWVYGPVMHEAPSLERFGGTQSQWYNAVVKGVVKGDALTKAGFEWIDVRDLAHAHTLALKTPEAGNERFIIRAGRAVWQDFVNAARRYSDKILEGDPTYNPEEAVFPSRYIEDKSIKLLGIKYRSLDDVTRDSLEDFKARGWL